MGSEPGDITVLLRRVQTGDRKAEADLMAIVYDQLHRIARQQLRRERPDNTLQPTELVSELYLRLKLDSSVTWQDRSHLFALAATNMRRILVDHARARNAQKRPTADRRIDIDEAYVYSVENPADLLALHEALERLARIDPRLEKVVELKCFGGLTMKEIGSVLGFTERTIKSDWNMARAWLSNELNGPGGPARDAPPDRRS